MMIQNQVRRFSATYRDQPLFRDDGKREKRDERQPFKWERVCPYCGAAALIPAGTCHICQNCGAGNGCS